MVTPSTFLKQRATRPPASPRCIWIRSQGCRSDLCGRVWPGWPAMTWNGKALTHGYPMVIPWLSKTQLTFFRLTRPGKRANVELWKDPPWYLAGMTSHILKMCIDRLRIFNYPMLVWSIRFRRKKIGWWKWIYHVQKKYGFSCWQKNKTLEKQVGTYTINIHIIYTWHNIIIYI